MGGTGFLIAELGRPERFLHMLRVAKPTSPMSMGSWLLAAHSGLASAAGGQRPDRHRSRPGVPRRARPRPLTGPLLATYTGVLLADTAVPAWHEGLPAAPVPVRGLGDGLGRGGRDWPPRPWARAGTAVPRPGWPCWAR